MKLEINYMKKTGKLTNRWGLRRSQKRIKKDLKTRENENVTYKNLWDTKAVHSDKCLLQEMRKVSNNLTLHLKELKKKKSKTMPKARRKKITKIQAEICEVET